MCEASQTDLAAGWVIEADHDFEVQQSDLLTFFPVFATTHVSRNKPDPRVIHGIKRDGNLERWTMTNPAKGNRWRDLSAGHRLPRNFVHHESNIHFLSTSNVSPPLEMLDEIADQLECVASELSNTWHLGVGCRVQGTGPWTIPCKASLRAISDSEASFFCRACWVKGVPEAEDEEEKEDDQEDDDDVSDTSSTTSTQQQSSTVSAQQPSGKGATMKNKKKKTMKKDETVPEIISLIGQFLTPAALSEHIPASIHPQANAKKGIEHCG
ncbi:hypothetical protein B0H10DRAFT_1943766 [Mycena sp. CBHHK59/15]|nr:hypothetical protein B0H10DRAFT_1943766 [Mycena sp. CBHHK59/15]